MIWKVGIEVNRYLEKIAETLASGGLDVNARLDREYSQLLDSTGATHVDVDSLFDKRYWKALKNGGHAFNWKVHKNESGEVVPEVTLLHARPGILTRAVSPLYGVLQANKDVEIAHRVYKVHEGIEADEFKNHLLPLIRQHMGEGGKPTVDRPLLVGTHTNPAVVMRESNLVREIGNPEALSRLHKYRRAADDPFLKRIAGKTYGSSFSEEDMVRARSFFDTPVKESN